MPDLLVEVLVSTVCVAVPWTIAYRWAPRRILAAQQRGKPGLAWSIVAGGIAACFVTSSLIAAVVPGSRDDIVDVESIALSLLLVGVGLEGRRSTHR